MPLFDQSNADEKVVVQLLKQPALSFIRELRTNLDKDQRYLNTHTKEISSKVQQLISQCGVYWDQEIFDREWERIVREAIIRLRTVEQ